MSLLAYYKVLFMTELLIAELLFCHQLPKRDYFYARLSAGVAFCYIVAVFFPVFPDAYNGLYSSFMFLCLAAAGWAAIMFSFRIRWEVGVFCLITAYTIQHMSYETYTLISVLFGASGGEMYSAAVLSVDLVTLLYVLVYVDVYLLIYWSYYILLSQRLASEGEVVLKNTQMLFFSVLILVIDIVINAFIVYGEEQVKMYNVIACIYNILCCAFVLWIQVNMIKRKEMDREIDMLSRLLNQSRAQYATTKENIELINLKVHDLKHQVARFAQNGGLDSETVAEIKRMISVYDTSVETGIEALDIVLTEKSLFCQKNGIKFSCMADCRLLCFIKESDLFVLFGNAVDNAIEAVMKIPDEDKRFIGLSVYARGNLISVNINNYCQGDVRLNEDGLPITTKRQKDWHGFGLKSIRMIAEKYDGTMTISIEENIFNLNIVIPIQR